MNETASNPGQLPFEPLSEADCQRLASVGSIVCYEPGECVIEPGTSLVGIHVVLTGTCLLTPASRMRARDGRALAGAGHCFGSLLVGVPELARFRVRALEPTRVLHLDPAAVQGLVMRDLPLGGRLLHQAREEQLAFYEGLGCAARTARIGVVYGLRGGAGATSFSIAMAASAAARDEKVLLVDLHPFFGNTASSCGLRAAKGLAHLPPTGAPDEATLGELITPAAGFDVLAAPIDPTQGEIVTWPRVEALLGAVADRYDLIVLDLPPGVDPLVLGAFDVADRVVLAATGDFPGLAAIRAGLALVDALGVERMTVEILVNRFQAKGGIREENIQRLVGQGVTLIPEDAGELLRAINEGKLTELVQQCPEHRLVAAARDVAARCVDPVKTLGPRVHRLEPRKLCAATLPARTHSAPPAHRTASAPRTGGLLATLGLAQAS